MTALIPVTEHVVKTSRHTSFYLSCGPASGPLIIFLHGWPELSISWRHQLPCFAALGFRAIAPDMRGYGRSSVYSRHEDYALEHVVDDMLELLPSLGQDRAVWVGHDWGSPVVWSIASHHPDRCQGVANLCVPYLSNGFSLDNFIRLVDRTVYPEEQYPAGQWEYMRFYEENFQKARSDFEVDVLSTVKALFRKGDPEGKGKPSRTAQVRHQGGWFGGLGQAPGLLLDTDVLTEEDLCGYVAALQRNGFFGPDSWYMNHRRNAEFATRAVNAGRLRMPVLFLHGEYDYTCETMTSRLAEPMRANCDNLTEFIVQSGHWPGVDPCDAPPPYVSPSCSLSLRQTPLRPSRPRSRSPAGAPGAELFRSGGGHYDVYEGGASFADVRGPENFGLGGKGLPLGAPPAMSILGPLSTRFRACD